MDNIRIEFDWMHLEMMLFHMTHAIIVTRNKPSCTLSQSCSSVPSRQSEILSHFCAIAKHLVLSHRNSDSGWHTPGSSVKFYGNKNKKIIIK